MSVRNIAIITLLAAAPMLLTAPAFSGDKVDIKTPGVAIDILNGNKRIQAGDAKIKPGKHGDCVRISAGNAKVANGKIKDGKCKS